jgi:hypothetical protein
MFATGPHWPDDEQRWDGEGMVFRVSSLAEAEAIAANYPMHSKGTTHKALPRSYDYVIVGAGSAGCVVVRRLLDRTDAPVVTTPRVEVRDQRVRQWRGGFHELSPRIPRQAAGPAELQTMSRCHRPGSSGRCG